MMNREAIAGNAVTSAHVFAAIFIAACALLAAAAGSFPIGASLVTVFLFAGLHNLFEFRYFAARLPTRWGRSRSFYTLGIGGVALLTSAYLVIYFASGAWPWSSESWEVAIAAWNTALVLWVATLVHLRGRHNGNRDSSWVFPAALAVAALAWLAPVIWSLALVYLHPFVAMFFLERQIRRTRKEWIGAYRLCLATIPVFLLMLYAGLGSSPDLATETSLFWRIAQHAGADALPGLSSRFLVAAHVFLESVHYAVWILIMPLVDRRAVPWRLSDVPLYASPDGHPRLFTASLILGAFVVLALWSGFSIDYGATRDVYFAFAIAHVLAELPFLVKTL